MSIFRSVDIRYQPGGIYEHSDKVPVQYLKFKPKPDPKLSLMPRALQKRQTAKEFKEDQEKPKTPPPQRQRPTNPQQRHNRTKPPIKTNQGDSQNQNPAGLKACPQHRLQSHDAVDAILLALPSPPLADDPPKTVPNEDIRNAQDLFDVLSLWQDDVPEKAIWNCSDSSTMWQKDSFFMVKEDQFTAIHSHRTLAGDEYPTLSAADIDMEQALKCYAPKQRLPISMDLNAFLNSKEGLGQVYLGISTDRLVKGLFLTWDQRNHVEENLVDLLTHRYEPPVPRDSFSLEFIKVTEPSPASQQPFAFKVDDSVLEGFVSSKPHSFRNATLCWCDHEALKAIKEGKPPSRYVVLIKIHRSETTDPLPPLYADELGCICVRTGPDNAIPTVDDVLRMAIKDLDELRLN